MKGFTIVVGAAVGVGLLALIGEYYGSTYTASAEAPIGRPVKNAASFAAPSLPNSRDGGGVVALNLSASNTVVYRSEVDALSVARAQRELLEKSRALGGGEPLYLVLDTPGGSIDAGNQLIDTAKSLGRPVHTITIFAASMGFYMVQRLGTRYVLPSGRLMAHRARVGGVGGQVPGEFITAASTILASVTKIEKQNALRLGISFADYTDLVRDEYWVDGEDAVRQNAADKLASIQCDKSLEGTYTETVQSFFGPVSLIWARCPAITLPLGFGFEGTEENRQKVREALVNYRALRKSGALGAGLGSL